MSGSLSEQFEETVWNRHKNPKSGWSRVPTGAVMTYALYRRDWRLLAAAVVWAAINPLLFSPPETDDAWMTRAVLAERWWIREVGNRTVGFDYPNVCNTAGAVGFVLALVGAWRKRPAIATLGTILSVGLKLWWLRVLVNRYDDREEVPASGQ